MFGLVEDLGQAVKGLGAVDLSALGDDELRDASVELARQRAALEAAHARLMRSIDRRGAYRPSRARSAGAWLAHRSHLPTNEANSLVALGRKMEIHPALEEAFSTGEISASHVRRLAAARNPRSAAAFRRDIHALLALARKKSFSEFSNSLDYWLLDNDADGADERAMDRIDRRRVSFDETIFGMWSSNALLDPVSGTIVGGELRRLAERLFQDDWAEAKARLEREPRSHELRRTADQRRADALVEMALRSAAMAPGSRKPATLLSVAVGEDRLKSLLELESGTVITPLELAHLLGRAEIKGYLFDGKGLCIEASRARTFTGALRGLVKLRDRKCADPTCDIPSAHCQVDHVVPYSAGGQTSQENGKPRCGFHNRLSYVLSRRPPPPED